MVNEKMNEAYKLVSRIAAGDKTAFETLYQLHHTSVFHYLYRLLKDEQTAQDLLIEVFCAVWKNADRFRGNSRVKTWLFGIARNMAYNELRRKGRYTDPLHERYHDEKSTGAFEKFENHQLVQKALANLSDRHREILDLVFFHDISYSQVAILLDIPENTVKTRVYYAKSALKQAIIDIEEVE